MGAWAGSGDIHPACPPDDSSSSARRTSLVTRAATFALGVLAGLLVGLWLIARSIATPETASVPRDPRIEELAVLAATGRVGLRWN